MFKKDGRLISHTMPPGGVAELTERGIEVGAYEYSGDTWEWTREL